MNALCFHFNNTHTHCTLLPSQACHTTPTQHDHSKDIAVWECMAELQQQQANGIAQHKRKLLLRLDDGSLIGPVETLLPGTGSHVAPGAVLLDFEAACRTGRAGKTELERLDRLIQDFQARVSGFHSIARSELKQRNPYTQDVQRAIKRQRSLAAGELPPFGPGGDALQQLQQQPLQQQPSGSLDFLPKCSGVLNRVYMACNTIQPMFGLHAKDVFYRPVRETFPNIAADYYARISHPMTFRTIEERISKGFYVNAQMFADDMRLVFENCKKYNPLAADPVRLASLKLSEVFENCWVSSGLCAEVQRAKRATAGIAAPKFEPEEYDGVGIGGVPRKTGSHRSAEQPGMQDGLARLPSHQEVSSYREEEVTQNERPIPEDILQFVAEQLQELGSDNLQVALGKFNEGVVTYDAEGEVELDLEKVNYDSLILVEAYIRELLGMPPRETGGARGGAAAGGAAAAAPSASDGPASGRQPSGVRAMDEDDDYYEEDDDSDDD